MKTVCLYHSADLDGHCSGAIVRAYYKEMLDKDVTCVGINYYYHPDTIYGIVDPGDEVYVVDFSLTPEDFHKLSVDMKCKITWIDHHASALNNPELGHFEDTLKGFRQVGVAACQLTWNYLFDEETTPDVVKYIGSWDLWDFSDPITKPFYAGMGMLETRPEDDEGFENGWTPLFNNKGGLTSDDPDMTYLNVFNLGAVVLEHERIVAKRAMSKSYDVMFDGKKFLTVCGYLKSSEDFASHIRDDHDGMCWYYWTGKAWKVSLRSNNEATDVSAIVAKYPGGGGHKAAAGFTTKELPQEIFTALEREVANVVGE